MVPTANIVPMWMTASAPPPPHLLDLAPKAYFFFWGVKKVLAGAFLTLESFLKIWEGVGRNIGMDQFAIAFRW
jgi:hypothetical protein